jgi:hypothetical protein
MVYGRFSFLFIQMAVHAELVRLHICMNDVCDKLNRSFKVNELVFQPGKTNCLNFAAKNKTCISWMESFYNKWIEEVEAHKFLRL